MTPSTPFRDLSHAANLRYGTDGFTSPPKEGVLRIFSPLKIRWLRPGLNPRTWVLKASTLPLDNLATIPYHLQIWHSPHHRDSSVGTATRYGMKSPEIETQCGARFSAPLQTGRGAHTASYTMGTGSFPGGKAAGAWRRPPTQSSAEVKGRVDILSASVNRAILQHLFFWLGNTGADVAAILLPTLKSFSSNGAVDWNTTGICCERVLQER